jgi:predicted dienelactone hydrolase
LLPAKEFVERPKDVSFLLDELAKLNQQKSLLQGKLNTQQVSLIGHSLGGYTALALAGAEVNISELRQFCKSSTAIRRAPADWLQCAAADLPDRKLKLRDQRVKSAIAFNPIIGNLFGKTGLTQVATPVLLLAGTEDAITPVLNHQLRPFSQLPSPKYLLTAIGGTHLSISDAVNLSSNFTNSNLVKERRGEETKSLRQLIQGVSLAFIKQLTPEARIYEPFLTPAYAESLSTPVLPLRFSTELPASITSWLDQTRG